MCPGNHIPISDQHMWFSPPYIRTHCCPKECSRCCGNLIPISDFSTLLFFLSSVEGNVDMLQSYYSLTSFTSKASPVSQYFAPLTFYAFSKLTPKNQTSLKIVPPPPRDVINNRSLNLHKTFSAFKCHSDMLPKTSGTFKIMRCAGCFVQHAHRNCRHHLFP